MVQILMGRRKFGSSEFGFVDVFGDMCEELPGSVGTTSPITGAQMDVESLTRYI